MTTAKKEERKFNASPAIRRRVPLWVSLAGPSGSGKTRSALRLATGMVKVTGGKIGVADSESDRALHYAPLPGEKADPANGTYDFVHIPFSPPFDSLSYLALFKYAASQGVEALIVDSMSHEHDGIGGLLEAHEAEIDAMEIAQKAKGKTASSRDALSMLAWNKPKMARRLMINEALQLKMNFIFCFRAKEKIKVKGASVTQMGWMPVAGEEMIFEMTVAGLLPPGSRGVPTWNPKGLGEITTVKLPDRFKDQFMRARPFDEEMGAALATWAGGGITPELSAAAKQGTAAERSAIIQELGRIRQRINWDQDKSKEWRVQVFQQPDITKFTAQQLEDARTLLGLLEVGQEEYDAELATMIELGRISAAGAA